MKTAVTILCGCVILCAGCGQSLKGTLLNDGIHSIRNYKFDPASDISSRIQPIPPRYLDLLQKLDGRSNYRDYSLNLEEMNLFNEYIALLPPASRKALNQSTVAVYFIENFAGAGMTDFAVGKNNEVFPILLINPEMMKKSMEMWLKYRDESGYKDDGAKIRVEFDCGGTHKALLYLLLHESSHIADYAHRVTPYVDPESAEICGINKNAPFTEGVWLEYRKPVAQYRIAGIEKLSPYGLSEPEEPLSEMVSHYKKLKDTPFVSLYGSRVWCEDFADSAVVYHLTQVMKLPYAATVYNDGGAAVLYSPA
ncbi:MAG: hypothetical protein ACRCUT_01465, partial [Spirochaetota bacterium]